MKEDDGLELLQQFSPVTTEQWEEVIRKDLKGADYDKKLVWRSDEQIAVKPYYRRQDLDGLDRQLAAAPGDFPFVRGTRSTPGWAVRQEIDELDVRKANQYAREALRGGADEVCFAAEPCVGGLRGVSVQTLQDMKQLLDEISLERVPLHFRSGRLALPMLLLLLEAVEMRGDLPRLQGSVDYDPITDLVLAGGSSQDRKRMFDEVADVVRLCRTRAQAFRPLTVRAGDYRECGGTVVQEVAFALGTGVEYLAELSARGLSVDDAASSLGFSLTAGTSYFFEIAKLRAFRLLWARAIAEFKPSTKEALKPVVHTRTSEWSATIYDPHVNVLRATTEAMSAAVGGSEAVTVVPFDRPSGPGTDLSRRLSRNTQTILKREASLGRCVDAAAGSYYIETLTDSIARAAWTLFQKIEAAGGVVKAIQGGLIQQQVRASRKVKNDAVASRRRTLLGTNHYPNSGESALAANKPGENVTPLKRTGIAVDTESAKAMKQFAQGLVVGDFVSAAPFVVEVEALQPYRAAQPYESLRLGMERYTAAGGRVPCVYLLEFGDLKMRKARSGFAANFFGCGGFNVVTGTGETLDASVRAAIDAHADTIVLCSSDAEYLQIAKPICEQVKNAEKPVPVLIAGYPSEAIEQLRADGVVDFIHVRSNALEVLSAWQRKLGVGE
ncbi:MAG TPA: methylmalonyl-CoA mutase family protein [Clostridia bacterium]|nr:methylmalonyl-CoA mutase family protein [Clostridia bacterium]